MRRSRRGHALPRRLRSASSSGRGGESSQTALGGGQGALSRRRARWPSRRRDRRRRRRPGWRCAVADPRGRWRATTVRRGGRPSHDDGAAPGTVRSAPAPGRAPEAPEYHRDPVSLTRLDLRGVPAAGLAAAVARPATALSFPTEEVRVILDEVRRGGDDAVRALTARFDGVSIDALRVAPDEIVAALTSVDPTLRRALQVAFDRILAYHRHEPDPVGDFVDGGVVVRHLVRAVGRVGIYAPGRPGAATLDRPHVRGPRPAWPAWTNWCCASPPAPTAGWPPRRWPRRRWPGSTRSTGWAASKAIAAMAFGTETVARRGRHRRAPGNRYVAEAKRQVSGIVGVPSAFAGPSEVVVVADDRTPVAFAAIDVVVQAEHGPDGLAWLVTWSADDWPTPCRPRWTGWWPPRPGAPELEATLGAGGYAVAGGRAGRGPGRGATWSPPSTWSSSRTTPRPCCPWCARPVPCSSAPTPRPAWATTWPARATCCPRPGPPASPRRCASTTSAPTSTPCASTRVALAGLAPHVVALAEAEGLPAHARSVQVRAEPARCDGARDDARVPLRPDLGRAVGLPLAAGGRRGPAQHQRISLPAARASGWRSLRDEMATHRLQPVPGPRRRRRCAPRWPSCHGVSARPDLLRQRVQRGPAVACCLAYGGRGP